MPVEDRTPQSFEYTTVSRSTNISPLATRMRYVIRWEDFRIGELNLAWKSQIKAGRDATTALTGQRRLITKKGDPSFVRRWNDGSAVQTIETTGFTVPPQWPASTFPDAELTKLRARLASSAVNEIRGRLYEVGGPVFLAELGQALRMIRNPYRASYTLLMKYAKHCASLKRKYKNDHRALDKAISSAWLETMFGWAPLIGDIQSGISAFENLSKSRSVSFKGGVSGEVDVKTPPLVQAYHSDYIKLISQFTDKTTYDARFSGRVRREAIGSPGSFNKLRNTLGFNLAEFVPSVWELVPFSFVADYFTNIGELLSGHYVSSTYIQFGYSTEKVESIRTCLTKESGSPSQVWYKPSSGDSFVPGGWETKVTTVKRSGLSAPNALVLSLPNPKQSLNLLALFSALR